MGWEAWHPCACPSAAVRKQAERRSRVYGANLSGSRYSLQGGAWAGVGCLNVARRTQAD